MSLILCYIYQINNTKKWIEMNANQITNETPIAFLTVGQLLELLDMERKKQPIAETKEAKQFVYGLRGIRSLFCVSHATAQRYKDTIIKEAVSQQGRKIVVDVDKALELFKNRIDC